ncbi:MMPL family transporter [Ralstonia solanacearum]|uniref:MMPL family transporter n=1 Tax=Ralstonia solanacearum TaxID=305 RepID=UPI001B3B469C|nr:MMPL family transporter [Ralstonia solanacearum]AST31106.2 MMPL family transporter [Ralstonia solanacearum]MDB0508607.1 MMPL family transporter [Ralstonia solanacearum]MDB0513872.1 MMPL family transporter [Ralstonia solanacearum]
MQARTSTDSAAHGLRTLRRPAVLVWLLGLLACLAVIGRTSFVADLSAFLPRSPSAEQRVLVDQLRDGLVSRLMLVAIEGGEPQVRAELSRRMAATLRGDARFASVSNGEPVGKERDQRFVFDHRYLLSPAVTPLRFSADGLHQALGDSLDLLSSSAGLVAKAMLPRDPTGEVATLVGQLDSSAQPPSSHGVWISRDGRRAVLIAQTAGAGSDTDAQALAMAAVRGAFEAAARALPDATACRLLMTGPGVFAVDARDTIRHDVERLSTLSLVLIVALLFVVYRSPRMLALGLLPVLTGVAAGVASVSLAFGTVHGLTLGFGTTLIGEAVDYSIYLFVQSAQPHARREDAIRDWIADYWPTIRLGVLTSVCGFASMLFSGFPGLVQLGLYSIAGLTTAALVTRFVLPHLHGGRVAIRDVSRLGRALARAARAAPRLRWPLAVLLIAACATLALHRDRLWNRELAALSPVPAQSQALDASLRADIGAPDVRYLVVISGTSEQAALEGAEKVSAQLQPLVDAGVLGGYDSPARFLPSDAAQRARLASLPSAAVLAARLRTAVVDQPIQVKPELFAPFLADVEAARRQPLLTRADLRGTSMALAVDALLTERAGRWSAMLPLRAPADAQTRAADKPSLDAAQVRGAVERAGVPDALFIDMKAEADRLYVNYVREDIRLSLAGVAAIALLLLLALRSVQRTVLALAPLAAAVLVVGAGFALAGVPLTILHLVGMLLIVAVGSNYALFFSRRMDASADAQPVTPQTLVSLLIANLATVAGFGLLALSHVPMLETFGLTVGPGAILALLFAAILAPSAPSAPSTTWTAAHTPAHPDHGDPA